MIPSDTRLAQLALDSYAKEPTISGPLPTFSNVHAVITTLFPIAGDGSMDADPINVASFRGSKEARDWAMDFLAIPVLEHATLEDGHVGLVHRGIAAGALSVLGRVAEALGQDPYALTGHSLGGGLALLTAAFLIARGHRPPSRIVTFAAPRVGMADYVRLLAPVSVTEYQFGNDVVPHVPGFLLHATAVTVLGEPRVDPLECHAMLRYLQALQVE